jgi:hypothetical protein
MFALRSIPSILLFLLAISVLAACTPVATPTPVPTQIPPTATVPSTAMPTQTPIVITATPGATPTPVIIIVTATPLPFTATQALTLVPTSPQAFTATPSLPSPTPTSSIIYFAPTLLDPPTGRTFAAKNTILRWKEQELKGDEVFDVLVWPEGGTEQTSIGTTRERIFPIDFISWKYSGTFKKFYWTIQIKRTDGTYLSGASQPFWFELTGWPEPPTPVPYPKPP